MTTSERLCTCPAVNSRPATRSAVQPSARASSASVAAIGELPTTTRCGAGSTGSMYTSSAPSLWQEIGTTAIPSGTASPNLSAGPSRSTRGWPSPIAARASRMTAGSAQAPPIQPRNSPSAVMIARDPCLPEDGPCRHTTVASANASPASASSVARCRRPAPFRVMPFKTGPPALFLLDRGRAGHVAAVREGLPYAVGKQRHVDVADASAAQGVHDRVDERRRPADRGALADALGADRVVRARGDDLAVQLEAGRLPGRREQVVHVVRADAVAVAVEGDELHARHGVGLSEAAHDLALDDHRVDPDAAVIDR